VYVWLAVISFGIINAQNGLGKTPFAPREPLYHTDKSG